MRLMLALIRGKRVNEALSILHFTPNHASIVAEQTLRSAIANFQLKPENSRHDIEDLVVRECFADGGAMLKRVLPAPMGRAFRVRKRSNHLTIVIGDKPSERGKESKLKSGKAKKTTAKTEAVTPEVVATPAAKKPRAKKAAAPKEVSA